MPIHAVTSEKESAKATPVSVRPSCPLCGEEMFAATASAFVDEWSVRSLWSCDACGCGFTTERIIVCH